MHAHKLTLISLALGASLAHAGATPGVLYRQGPAQGEAFVSSTEQGGFPSDDRRTADSFRNEGDWALSSVVWWGGDETDSPAMPLSNIHSFEITFYNPTSFFDPTPASVIHTETVTLNATNPTATGATVGDAGAPEFRFEHAFDSFVLLFFNQVHPVWLSISANYFDTTGFSDSFLWSGSFEGDDLIAFDSLDGGGYELGDTFRRNAAFELYGIPFPAPGSFSLLGIAGVTAACRRR